MTKPDLSKLRHALVNSPLHFYYEVGADGTRVLRHIRVQQKNFKVPADGVTIDVVPPNSVGSDEIKDGSVQAEDLDPRIITTTDEARGIVARAIAKAEGE